jgi:hypothetical protein
MSKDMSIICTHPENVSIKSDFVYTSHKPYTFRESITGDAYFIEDGRGLVVAGVINNREGMSTHSPLGEGKDMANYLCKLLNEAT